MKIAAATLGLGFLSLLATASADETKPAEAPKPAEETKPAQLKLEVQNLDMEAGDTIPTGWTGKFGTCLVTRDTTVFHSGKASLCVDRTAQNDNRNACAHQMVLVPAGAKLTFKGWVKTEGAAKVSYAAQFFNERFTTNDCYPVKTLDGVHDWQELSAEITVPENATRLAIALYVEGQGRAWLDDVKIQAEDNSGISVVVKTPDPNPKAPSEPSEARLIPVTAVPGYFPNQPRAWQLFHESQVRQARNETMDVVFIGDSLTQGWTTVGRESWAKNFEPLKAACFGIAGDTTGNVLWRLDNGLLDFHAPKVVVLMVGASNLWSGRNTSEEIVDGYRAIIEKLRARVPDTQILVLGVLPVAPALTDLARQRATELNVLAAQLNDWNSVKFANFAPKFIRRDGRLQDEFYQSDNMNLTAKGYEAFAKELTPIVMEMLKPIPTTTPAAPEPELGPVGR